MCTGRPTKLIDVIHVYTPRQLLLVRLNHGIFTEYLMGGACGTYGEQENYIRRLWWE